MTTPRIEVSRHLLAILPTGAEEWAYQAARPERTEAPMRQNGKNVRPVIAFAPRDLLPWESGFTPDSAPPILGGRTVLARRSERRGNGRWLTVGLILLVGVAFGVLGMHYLPAVLPPEQTAGSGAAVSPPTQVGALGRLQPFDGIISIYGPPGDRIEQLGKRARAGETVPEKEVLALLASKADRHAEQELAQKQLDEAKALRNAIEAAWKAKNSEIEAEIKHLEVSREYDESMQQAKINVLTVQKSNAVSGWERRKNLELSPISIQEKEQYQVSLKQIEGELEAATLLQKKANASYEHSKKVARAKQHTASLETTQALERVPVDSLQQSLTIAERHVNATTIKAPVGGTILRVGTRQGDAIGPQPIIQMANLDRMAVVAEVPPEDIPRLRAWLESGGVDVKVESKVFPEGPLLGELRKEEIAQIVGRNTIFPLDPRAETDPRMVEVRVELKDPQKRAAQYVGLDNVRVTFTPKEAGQSRPSRATP